MAARVFEISNADGFVVQVDGHNPGAVFAEFCGVGSWTGSTFLFNRGGFDWLIRQIG